VIPLRRAAALILLAGCTGKFVEDDPRPTDPPAMPGTPSTPGAPKPGGPSTPTPPTTSPPAAGPCRVAVPLRRLTERQYANAVRELFRGQVPASGRFPASELGAARSGFSTEPAANQVTLLGAENILDAAEETALAVADKLPALLPCAASAPGEACAGTFLDDVGARAFRRPLTAEERALLLGVFRKATGASAFKDGIALLVSALLQAPQFLYLTETGKPIAGAADVVELTDFEVAARLSFLLWDGPPDAALMEAATQGNLRTGSAIRAQAERMLADPRARATIARFGREWTNLHVWKPGEKASKEFTEAMATGMQNQFDLFMHSAFLEAGTVRSLLTSAVDPAHPAGLLTLPAFLSSAAHGDEPSYVKRGVFVLRNLLCQDLPEPPPDAATRQPNFPAGATQRQKSAAIRAVAECGVCHGLIDDIGLGFDGYDELGRVRPGADQHGAVNTGLAELDGPFDGPAELAGKLAASRTTETCLARQWLRFALGRLDGSGDSCALDTLTRALDGSGQSLRQMILSLVEADAFRFRRVGGAP
jgi:hypothetical protein